MISCIYRLCYDVCMKYVLEKRSAKENRSIFDTS